MALTTQTSTAHPSAGGPPTTGAAASTAAAESATHALSDEQRHKFWAKVLAADTQAAAWATKRLPRLAYDRADVRRPRHPPRRRVDHGHRVRPRPQRRRHVVPQPRVPAHGHDAGPDPAPAAQRRGPPGRPRRLVPARRRHVARGGREVQRGGLAPPVRQPGRIRPAAQRQPDSARVARRAGADDRRPGRRPHAVRPPPAGDQADGHRRGDGGAGGGVAEGAGVRRRLPGPETWASAGRRART